MCGASCSIRWSSRDCCRSHCSSRLHAGWAREYLAVMFARSHRYIVLIVALVGLIAASRPPFAQPSVPHEVIFGLIGDLAYTEAQEPLLDNVLADLNRTPL